MTQPYVPTLTRVYAESQNRDFFTAYVALDRDGKLTKEPVPWLVKVVVNAEVWVGELKRKPKQRLLTIEWGNGTRLESTTDFCSVPLREHALVQLFDDDESWCKLRVRSIVPYVMAR